MKILTDQEKQVIQDNSWKDWCLDLLDRRFYNVDPRTDQSFAVLALDEYPYAVVLYGKMFLIKCVLNEGYPR